MGKVPPQFEFFFDGDNESFVNACNLIRRNEDNNEFVYFLCSDMGQNMMTDKSLSIHTESGNIFSDNFNKNKNFLLHNKTKQKRTLCHHSFQRYMKGSACIFPGRK